MSSQLMWLAYTTIFTAVLWVPYILDCFIKSGIMGTLGNPQDRTNAPSAWATRLKAAHYNAVENLAVTGILVIIAELVSADVSFYAMVYFFSRVIHSIVYAIGLPAVRTVCFLVGFAMQVLIFTQLM